MQQTTTMAQYQILHRKPSLVKIVLYTFIFLGVLSLGYLLYPMEIDPVYYLSIFWILSVAALLWSGNVFIYKKMDQMLPWAEYTTRRFWLQLIVSSLYSLLCVNLSYYVIKSNFTESPPDFEQILILNIYGLLFIFPVVSLHFGFYFLTQWKKAFQQTEHLKQENLQTQLESLRNHLDPHFLFNNLNILSALIGKQNHEAQTFLESFSDVYRYVLQHKHEELVKLETELEFVDAYFAMLKQRYKNNLKLSVHVDKSMKKRLIPPLSLQMLIENIIKHNIATDSQQLLIEIFTSPDEYLCVRNNLQKKETTVYSGKSGLENISKRYNYLSDRLIQVVENDENFAVRLPLLKYDLA